MNGFSGVMELMTARWRTFLLLLLLLMVGLGIIGYARLITDLPSLEQSLGHPIVDPPVHEVGTPLRQILTMAILTRCLVVDYLPFLHIHLEPLVRYMRYQLI